MAIVHFVKSKRTQTVGGLNAVINYCCKDAKVDYHGRPLISGINCVPQCALQEFMNTKRLRHSTQGRMYYHMVQSFRPDDPVTPEQAHEIALKLAEQIPGFEIVVATHTDRDHIHSHFVINSVSCDTGLKYHSNRESLEMLWKASDELCLQYGLSVVKAVLDLDDSQPDLSDLGTDAAYLAAGLTNIIDDRPVEDSTTKHYRPERKKRHGQTMGGM